MTSVTIWTVPSVDRMMVSASYHRDASCNPNTDLEPVQVTLGHASHATTSISVSLSKRAQKKALQEHAL